MPAKFSDQFEFERVLWRQNVARVAGVDEAGRGPLAGPVVAAAAILQATHRAMNHALSQLNPLPPHALIDGRPVKTLRVPQTAIVKGDARSYSIAAASVLAKVTRDRLMLGFHAQFPEYGFAEHKGYGTAKHLAAIAQHGACPIHRMTFAPLKTKLF